MKTKILMAAVLSGIVMTAAAAQDRERPTFEAFDVNGDGAVTLEEMQTRSDARFGEMDANSDGGLSADELIAAANDRTAERVAQMLARSDENGDGILQQSELSQRGGDRTAQMFDRVDADSDGAITQAEFEAAKDRTDGQKRPRDRG